MKKLEINMESFMEYVEDKKIIAYGAGKTISKVLFEFQVLKEMYRRDWTNELFNVEEKNKEFVDLNSKIEYVVDSNIEKWGGKVKKKIDLLGRCVEIKSPENLFFLDHKKYVLFITSVYAEQIIKSLERAGISDDFTYVVSNQFYKEGYEEKTIGYYYQKILQPVVKEYMNDIGCDAGLVNGCINELCGIVKNNELIIPHVAFKITTKCTLKCQNCIDLVPYLNQRDVPIEKVINDIDIILNNAKKVYFVHLTTGEVLLYPYLDQVLKKLVESDKVKEIGVTTNGTTLPFNKNAIQYLQNPKVEVGVSDYGDIKGMARIVSFCEKNNIKVMVVEQQKWMDTGRYPKKRNKSKNELKFEFDHCYIVQDCPNLMAGGKFYACGKTEHFADLGEYDGKHDYANLINYSDIELKKKIYGMYCCDYLESCDICDTFSDAITDGNKNWVVAGKQRDGFREIERSNFTLHKRETS